ncbi:MAG TPA: hypothetical protein VGE74_16080, partial [Gemmata sp.]
KLEGDTLVVAFIKSNKTLLPTEFKARAEATAPGQPTVPGVTVITMKRTNDRPTPPRAAPRAPVSNRPPGHTRFDRIETPTEEPW